MKIVISNTRFDFNIGCRLLKCKYRECPTQFENVLGDMWNDIQPMTFQEIARDIQNIEERRVAISCLGIEKIVEQVQPKLVDKQTLKKSTTWINQEGNLETKSFDDTYELYEVEGKHLLGDTFQYSKYHYVKFKCTSTDREYMIWVDANDVRRTNNKGWSNDVNIDAIEAIAWTITTTISKDLIEKIVRQGDCIMIKKKVVADIENYRKTERHLTKQEYLSLLVAES